MRNAWSDTVSLNNSPIAIILADLNSIILNNDSTHGVLEVQVLRTLELCQVVDFVLCESSCSRIVYFVLLKVLLWSLMSNTRFKNIFGMHYNFNLEQT